MDTTNLPLDHARLSRAVARASEWHAAQLRKGTTTPYIAHLFAVAALVLEDDGDEDQLLAALLHDAAEDAGGEQTLSEIEAEFGARVAAMVRACSDSLTEDPDNKAPWRERKEEAVHTLSQAPDEALVVAAADKLHNLRTTLADVRLGHDDVWDRFKTGKEGFVWYNNALHEVFEQRIPRSRSVRLMGAELESGGLD